MHCDRRRVLVTLALAWPALAFAGAWDAGSFDNGDALEWVATCTRTRGPNSVEKALEATLKPGYLEAPEASAAIAAAEVVAAANGKPHQKFPKELATWLGAQKSGDIASLAPVASRAVDRILSGKGSELQELWKESRSFGAWEKQMRELQERLR